MSEAFDSEATARMARALQEALARLKRLGLTGGDGMAASALLTKLIMEAVEGGERNEEKLALYAVARFQGISEPDSSRHS